MTTLRQLFGFITSRKGDFPSGPHRPAPRPARRTSARLTVTRAQRTQTPAASLRRFACYRGSWEIVSSFSLPLFLFPLFYFLRRATPYRQATAKYRPYDGGGGGGSGGLVPRKVRTTRKMPPDPPQFPDEFDVEFSSAGH